MTHRSVIFRQAERYALIANTRDSVLQFAFARELTARLSTASQPSHQGLAVGFTFSPALDAGRVELVAAYVNLTPQQGITDRKSNIS